MVVKLLLQDGQVVESGNCLERSWIFRCWFFPYKHKILLEFISLHPHYCIATTDFSSQINPKICWVINGYWPCSGQVQHHMDLPWDKSEWEEEPQLQQLLNFALEGDRERRTFISPAMGSALMGNWEIHYLPAQLMLSQLNFWLAMSFLTEKPLISTITTVFVIVKKIHWILSFYLRVLQEVKKFLFGIFLLFSLHFFPCFSCTWENIRKAQFNLQACCCSILRVQLVKIQYINLKMVMVHLKYSHPSSCSLNMQQIIIIILIIKFTLRCP